MLHFGLSVCRLSLLLRMLFCIVLCKQGSLEVVKMLRKWSLAMFAVFVHNASFGKGGFFLQSRR